MAGDSSPHPPCLERSAHGVFRLLSGQFFFYRSPKNNVLIKNRSRLVVKVTRRTVRTGAGTADGVGAAGRDRLIET